VTSHCNRCGGADTTSAGADADADAGHQQHCAGQEAQTAQINTHIYAHPPPAPPPGFIPPHGLFVVCDFLGYGGFLLFLNFPIIAAFCFCFAGLFVAGFCCWLFVAGFLLHCWCFIALGFLFF
jgi:hypothetical protein